jgi:hypothetical protein
VTAAQAKMFRWGLTVAIGYALASCIIFLLKDDRSNGLFCMCIFLFYLLVSLPGQAFRNDWQVDWYRRALFLPLAVPWGLVLVAVILDFTEFAKVAWIAAMLAVLVAPVVWLVGALWLWRSNRWRRRAADC